MAETSNHIPGPDKNHLGASFRRNAPQWIGVALFVAVILLVGSRIPNGVDYSDESYYAIFIDDWLKGGIKTSSLITLHQTAALLVYPAALVYNALNGSSDGLFLFLRFLFLIGSFVSAAVSVRFLSRLGHRTAAWAAGALIVAFIPFGLPSPSYNTIGLQALTCALALFGIAAIDPSMKSTAQRIVLASSGIAWAIATVAYPPLVAPFAFLCFLGLLDRRIFPQPRFYFIFASAAIVVAWTSVIASLSFQRLYDSFIYQSSISDAGGIGRRLTFAFDLLQSNPAFALLCAAAVAVGLARQLIGPHLTALLSTAVISSLFLLNPVFFARSHDAITVATLTGLGLLAGFRRDADAPDRAVAIIYATSVFAALTTSLTAYNSAFNFCIGAIPAAVIALVGRPSSERYTWMYAFPSIAAIVAVLSTSLVFYYGEVPGRPFFGRERVRDGFFAGIALHPDDNNLSLLRLMRENVNPILIDSSESVAVIARVPGIILASPARLKMPYAFPLLPTVSQEGLARTRAFYAHSHPAPQVVLIYKDPYFEPVDPFQITPENSTLLADLRTSLGRLTVHRRN